jgi:hypothetical protein
VCAPCNERLAKDPSFNSHTTTRRTIVEQTSRTTVEQWTRRSGNLILGITPGRDFENNRSIGYPYGVIPRLLLLWIITEAIHTRSRRLHLGRSLADFMREVGLNPNNGTGKRSDAKRLHEQMHRLFSSRISFQQTTEIQGAVGKRWLNMEIAPEGELWWDPKEPGQGALWQSWIELGQKFYDAILASPVPLDMRALRKLKRSPLDLDLYCWVCYRAYVIVQKNQQPQFMSWSLLKSQLGADYDDEKDFKKKARAALRTVAAFYPGLTIGKARGGFTIHATRLAVPPKVRELPE